MQIRPLLTGLISLVPVILFACSCMPTSMSFSLMRYDEAELIIEVVAGEQFGEEQPKLGFDYLEGYRKELEKAEAEGRIPPPPPPPPPIRTTGKVSAQVKTTFKGALEFDEIILKSDLDGASCGWLPRPGTRYILYLGKPAIDQEATVFWVGSCTRKTNALRDNYADEKQILTLLSKTVDGEIAKNQVINMHAGAMEYCPFKGSFKDGKRVGKWLIYPPVYFWRDTLDFYQPALVFEYDGGELTGSEDLIKVTNSGWFNWIYYWKLFYFNPLEED